MIARSVRLIKPYRFVRFNSIKPTPRGQGTKPTQDGLSPINAGGSGSRGSGSNGGGEGPKFSKGKILGAIGVLAVVLTVAALVYDKRPPLAAVEPTKALEFTPQQVSVIFVLGGPGLGKGTQCDKLVKEYGFVHLSAGDLLRAEQARPGSKYGELIANYIKNGQIVPQEITVALLQQAIRENHVKGNQKFLVDGFPRKMDQAITFENDIVQLKLTIFFECPEQVMLQRLMERGKTLGRADDNVELIKKRFQVFVDTLMPVVDYFDKQGRVVKVRCDLTIDDVNKQLVTALKQRGVVN